MQTTNVTTQENNQEFPLPTPPNQLVTCKQLAKMIPANEGRTGSIRWQIFNSATNGLKESGAIIRNGRKILIDVEKYFAWLNSKTEK